jgi:hypothetical protein
MFASKDISLSKNSVIFGSSPSHIGWPRQYITPRKDGEAPVKSRVDGAN